MRIGIDIDDVLFPFYANAHQASERYGITNGVTPTLWRPYDDYGCHAQLWFDALEVATKDGSLYEGEPLPGSVEALANLRVLGHQLHLVTARGYFAHGDQVKVATINWLNTWQIPYDSITFTQDKTLVAVDVAVDDKPENVFALEEAGIPTWLVRAPHNAGVAHPRIVDSLADFANAAISWEAVS